MNKRDGVKILMSFLFLLITINMAAQQKVKLWSGNPPSDNKISEPEQYDEKGGWVTNVTVPEMIIYQPEKAQNTGVAVVICPGGGYGGLAIEHEGTQFAEWLSKQGITGIVLKYRLPNGHNSIPLEDAQQAIRYIRKHAKDLGIKENKIGIAGFSAGGHLAATVSTSHFLYGTSAHVDFSILFYPVITMKVSTHGGSRFNLLGDNPSETDIERFSNEMQVNRLTPPTILMLSDDDESVQTANSIAYYDALKENGVSATMYIFPEGGHGWGMRNSFKYHDQMLSLLQMWLKDIQNR